MVDPLSRTVDSALAGDRRALRAFVDATTPAIHARVVRVLLRRSPRNDRDIRQEIEDVTQDVFGVLFAQDGRVLRAWDAARGLSLLNFVGLIAERHALSVLRSGRRNPWRDVPEDLDELESAADPVPDAEPQIQSRETLVRLLERMREALSPRGLVLFERIYVDGESIEVVAESVGMSRDAIYTWRQRVTRILRQFTLEAEQETRPGPLDPAPIRRNPQGPRHG